MTYLVFDFGDSGRILFGFQYFANIFFSFISGISLLGTPTEIYVYGIQYMYVIGGVVTMGFVMTDIYLPVFHGLQLTSTYEVIINICLNYFKWF